MIPTEVKEIRKEKLARRTLAHVNHTGPYRSNPELFDRLFKQVVDWAQPKGLMKYPKSEAISVYYDDPDKVPEEKHRISVGFTVPEGTKGEGDVMAMELPAGDYVVGSFEIDADEYGQAWDEVFDYIRSEELEPAEGPMYESYKNDPNEHPEGKHLVDIAVRLKS